MSQDETRESLTPENIDLYIAQMANGEPAETRLSTDLQQFFQAEIEEDEALARVHQRLRLHMSTEAQKKKFLPAQRSLSQRERNHSMNIAVNAPHGPIFNHRLALVTASTTAILLIASFLFALQMRHTPPQTAIGTGTNKLSTPLYVSVDNQLIKLDPQTKKVLWSYTVGPDPKLDRTNTDPIVDGNTVYFVATKQEKLYALNTQTGKARWNYSLDRFSGEKLYVVDGVIYINNDVLKNNQWTTEVLAMNADGKLKKNYGPIGHIEGILNGVIYTAQSQAGLTNILAAVQITSGRALWHTTVDPKLRISTSVFIKDSTIYVATNVTYNGPAKQANPTTYIYTFDARTGTKLWSYPVTNSAGFYPLAVDPLAVDEKGMFYFLTSDVAEQKEVVALDTQAKKLVWKKNIGRGDAVSNCIISDNTLYLEQSRVSDQGNIGNLIALDTATGSQKAAWQFKPAGPVTIGALHLVQKDGTIYLGTDINILGIDTKERIFVFNLSFERILGRELNADVTTLMVN